MSDVLIEVANQSFSSVTVNKASTGQPITEIAKGASKIFKLLDGSSVQISAVSAESATVALDGVEEDQSIHVAPGQEQRDLYSGSPVTITPSQTTRLSLESVGGTTVLGVKCGEIIVQPPAA